jgi:hypothetical protein
MEIGCGDGALGYLVVTLLLLHRKPELLPYLFFFPLEVRPLKVAYGW